MAIVAAYDFDEGSGTTVADASGNGNAGTISNATWIVADKSFSKFNGSVDNVPSKAAGKYGSALVFNGTNALVTVPNSSSLQLTTGMTLEAWVNPSVVDSNWRDVIYKADDNFFLEATSTGGGNPPAAGGTFGSSNVFTAGMSALPVNAWTHLAETYDGATLKLYVNGVQASSRSQTGNILTSTNPLQIGGDSLYGQYFQGIIDEVRIYNTALTQAQIQADMNTPIGYVPPPDTTPPTAPSNLIATVASGSQINLSWTASTDNIGVNGYFVNRQNPSGLNFVDGRAVFNGSTFVRVGAPTTTTYSDTGLSAGTTYSYRIQAMDAAGNLSGYSNTVVATTQTLDTTPPSAPTGLTATTVNASQIDLSWTASTDNVGVTGYLIEREDPGSSSFVQIGTSASTSFGDTNLIANSTYSYRVRATDGAGNLSSYSSVASATTSTSGTVTTYTLTGPSSGTVATASSNFTVTLGTGTVSGTIHFVFSASNGDGTFNPTVLNLTNTTRSGVFTYTPNLWGSRTISVTNNGGLTDPSPLSYVSMIQLGSSGTAPSGTQCLNLGGFNFFATGNWWQELGRTVTSDAVASNSASLLSGFGSGNLRVAWWTSTANNGNSMYGMPYNVVAGTQSNLPLTLGAYASQSDPGPVPFFPSMTIQGWYSSSGVPPTSTQIDDNADHHAFVIRRNETTGGIDRLYEYYQVYSNDGGSTWGSVGGAQFDMTTGAIRPEGWTTSDAAGLPWEPLLVLYDDAARGSINHPIRMIIPPGLSRNNFVWPARHAVYTGSTTTGLPMGARLRLSESWYNAHINDFSQINRAVVTALRNYGGIIADLGGPGLWIDGTNDQRWDADDVLNLQNIPVSAFEVLDTIKTPLSFTGPTSGAHGVSQTFTIEYLISADSNFGANVYLENSTDGGSTWNVGNSVNVNDNNRGPLSLTFTPPAAGTYLMRIFSSSLDWIMPSTITFTAT